MNQEERDNLNRQITKSEIQSVIKQKQKNKQQKQKQTPYKQKSRTSWLHK